MNDIGQQELNEQDREQEDQTWLKKSGAIPERIWSNIYELIMKRFCSFNKLRSHGSRDINHLDPFWVNTDGN